MERTVERGGREGLVFGGCSNGVVFRIVAALPKEWNETMDEVAPDKAERCIAQRT
jgi:hypothetical protein